MRMANLSNQGRQVEALRDKLNRHTGRRQPVSGVLYAEIQELLKAAVDGHWEDADKHTLADLIASLGSEKVDFGGKAKEIKRAIRQLKGEA